MGHVLLSGPGAVVAGLEFSVRVTVHGARPGITLEARLRQTGPPSQTAWSVAVPISATGTGYGAFEKVVAGYEPYSTFTGDVPADADISPDTLLVAVRALTSP